MNNNTKVKFYCDLSIALSSIQFILEICHDYIVLSVSKTMRITKKKVWP